MSWKICLRAAAVLVLFSAGSRGTLAHPLSVSSSQFAVEDRAVHAVVRLPLDDVDLLLRLDRDLDLTVTEAEIGQARAAVQQYLANRIELATASRVLEPVLQATAIWKDQRGFPYLETKLSYSASGTINDVAIRVGVLTDLHADHRNLSEVAAYGRRDQFVFQHGNSYSVRRPGIHPWQAASSLVVFGLLLLARSRWRRA